jgi:hypothetical protein
MPDHFCGVEVDDAGMTVTVAMDDESNFDEDGNPDFFTIDQNSLCGQPAGYENPEYLLEDGFFNYAHWLCDEHWQEMMWVREEDEENE